MNRAIYQVALERGPRIHPRGDAEEGLDSGV